ncbi:MAG: hypothetical protein M1834_004845 [Cirrosporium novae-zelandiae]|nr:MAG: hypothetical protein M1834_004845 [Cirrosporium novae-zelandiae]
MTTFGPTAGWDKIGDRFYRKVRLYDGVFDQDLELENYVVVGAPYGGAVALYRDEDKLYAYRGVRSSKSSIDIYSCAGKLIREINWDKGSIRGLGWSEDEKLLVVTQDGNVRCYYDLQGDFTQFSLGSEAEEVGVESCRFWSSGFVAKLANQRLVQVSNYDEPRPKLLETPPEGQIHSWAIIPPRYTLSRSVEVLLAVDQTIYVIDASEAEDRVLQNGPFRHVSVSPDGHSIALYTEDGTVWVVSYDFQLKLTEYSSRARTIPKDVQWCGDDAIVLAWEDEIHVVDVASGAAEKYFFDSHVHLIPDIDGVRLLTNDVCEFLQKVPDVTKDVFRVGSTEPSAVLLDTVEQLERKSPKANDNIQLIRPSLADAVDACTRAAGYEFTAHWQKQLMKAASFGKSALEVYNSDEFVEMCENLRVLNAVRDYRIGLPVSYRQYLRLAPEKLIARLVNRREYLLAIRVSEYLRKPTDGIYVHWACQKVRASTTDDETISSIIVQRISGKQGVSFESIARAAYDEGRMRLATELLNSEPRAGKQVPLLLEMEEDENALDKAIQSGDTDLVFFVLLQLKKKLPLASFFRVINSRPVATALVESSAKAEDFELLKDLYYQDDRRIDGSDLLFGEAMGQDTLQTKTDKLRLAAKVLSDSKDPVAVFHQKNLSEAQVLLKMQEAFDKDISDGNTFTGLSVNETMFKLIRTGYSKRAQKVQSEFKVPEKTFWWIKLRALVAKRDWGELEESSRMRKSPIGWEPFFNEVLGAGNTKLASSYIPKCTHLTPAERIEMWMKCGLMAKAGEEALKAKDMASLEMLKGRASGSAAIEIERMINQLKPKR